MPDTLIVLQNAHTRLTLSPALGASIVDWRTLDERPLLRPSDADALAAGTPRRLACFPLVPWSNRIGSGGFDTPDGWFSLTPNSDHDPLPIHGSAWQQAWQVARQTPRQAVLFLNSTTPFAYEARQTFELVDNTLRISLDVTHRERRPLWHGLGWHPYLPRTPHTRLQASACRVWLTDARGLPTEPCEPPSEWRFDKSRDLPVTRVDHCFSGWNGGAVISQPDLGYRLDLQVGEAEHFLLFCPPDQPFFCFEPVTHPPNAHHLPGNPGLQLLAPGQCLSRHLSLTVHPLSPTTE